MELVGWAVEGAVALICCKHRGDKMSAHALLGHK